MKVYGVRIFVSDLTEARAFYADALGLPISFESDGAIGFNAGIEIIVEEDDGSHDGLRGRFTGISLSAKNLPVEYEALKAGGVRFVTPPEEQPWGDSLATF